MRARSDVLHGTRPERVSAALEAALAFVRKAQRPSGEIPVEASTDPRMREGRVPDPSVFPTALAAQCLAFAGEPARPMIERACDFLLAEMDKNGLWKHWSREHPHHAQLPADLDDTACASAALVRAGYSMPDNRGIVAANRTRAGMFLTWIVPRFRWTGSEHMRAALPRLLHPVSLLYFFRQTSARPGDVDAVVNANALHYLRGDPRFGSVATALARVLTEGREAQADKWYDNPIVVRYFLSRALVGVAPGAGPIIVERSEATTPATPLEAALLACTLVDWGREADPLVDYLLESQDRSGGWPAAALYHGGRNRLPAGGFASPHPDTPRWGSEALTTAFCIEALCRSGGAGR